MSIMSRGVLLWLRLSCIICFIHFVDYAIGKTIRVAPSDIFGGMSTTIEKRVLSQGIPYVDNFLDELGAKSRLTAFVPACRFDNISLNLGRKLEPPVHFL